MGEGYSLLYHRRKICHVEVDLIVTKDGVVTLVEVKTLASFDHLSHRLSASQKQRLLRARAWFENYYRVPTELSLVVVPSDLGGIQSFLVT
ncbi:MAG: YraN family protein [Bdellovibrionales bacterium]|nr:YraN family protein [Bdellovibrionales bacterium]